jgi:hypothetical protein
MIGEFAGRLPADFDKEHPVYPKLDAILHELIEGYEDKVEIFVAANEKLKGLIGEQDAARPRSAEVAAKQVEKREKLALARKAAEDAIQRPLRGRQDAAPVLDFLVNDLGEAPAPRAPAIGRRRARRGRPRSRRWTPHLEREAQDRPGRAQEARDHGAQAAEEADRGPQHLGRRTTPRARPSSRSS